MSHWTFPSGSDAETEGLGRLLGEILPPGMVIALNGDPGTGKTGFVRGVAAGLGTDPGDVSSPTFTLIHEYPGRRTLYHLDTWRLSHPAEFSDLGIDELFAADAIVAIEWADRVESLLPPDRLTIDIEAVGETTRVFSVTAGGTDSELVLAAWRSASDSG